MSIKGSYTKLAMKRVHIRARGVVQGVCFRYYAQRRAEELSLAGWVRNLMDGSIEALVEGGDSEVGAMIQWFRHGPPGAVVDECEVEEQPYKGEFKDFSVRPYER